MEYTIRAVLAKRALVLRTSLHNGVVILSIYLIDERLSLSLFFFFFLLLHTARPSQTQ